MTHVLGDVAGGFRNGCLEGADLGFSSSPRLLGHCEAIITYGACISIISQQTMRVLWRHSVGGFVPSVT